MSTHSKTRPTSRRGGFSVIEVMFAIMVLGIGFIMVAAIFPVGIQQGRDAVDDTTGQTIARQATYRALSALRMVSQDPTASKGPNYDIIRSWAPLNEYRWLEPLLTPAKEITIGTSGTPPYGGGKFNFDQMLNGEWQYQGGNEYVSQVLVRAAAGTGAPCTFDLIGLAFRDGRAAADQGLPLGAPYMEPCEVAFDSVANVYSDVYVRHATATDAQVEQFLGTRGTIIVIAGPQAGDVLPLADEERTVIAQNPVGHTWFDAYMVRTDVPMVGKKFKLTVTLP